MDIQTEKLLLIEELTRVQDARVIAEIRKLLLERIAPAEGQIWKTLTEAQKAEVYLSYQESEDDQNLIDWDDIKNKP